MADNAATAATSPLPPPPPSRRARHARRAAAACVLGAGVLGWAGVAGAASVAPRPFPGPTGCAALARAFGGGPYDEIRFSELPAVGATRTATHQGVTVTVHRLSPSSLSFTASDGVDLVFVNAGRPPHGTSAVYRYQPEARADSGLTGTTPSDILDHVVVCVDRDYPSPTSTPATTSPTTTASVPAEAPPVVRSCAPCYVRPREVPQRVPPAATPLATPTPTPPATAAPVASRLPETGGPPGPTVLVGAAALVVGALALRITRVRRPASRP